ncbi:MAG: hypothetical protein M3419_06030 [Actinomycetota bacterium]|nr:hypothetical protein [Actinomycetota bacterium]
MMEGYFDVAVERVFRAGMAVTATGTDWERWSGLVRTTLEDAVQQVRDATVAGSLSGAAGDVNQAVGRLVVDVDALGTSTAGAACDVARGDEDATGAARPALAANVALPVFERLV